MIKLFFILALLACIPVSAAEKKMQVDMLDYFLQTDDKNESWTLGGTDIRPDKDPDGTDTRTVILNKFSNPGFYEVFKVTDSEIQLRYEVFRPGGSEGKGNWIRRFEETKGEGKAPGAVWMKRYMTPGGEGILSRFHQDRLAYDEASKSYVIDKPASVDSMRIYESVVWAVNDCSHMDKSSFKPVKVIRYISEWHDQGRIFETYDYAKGKGMVAWRWMERISTLTPAGTDKTGKVFHCENGFVYVASRGDGKTAPVVYQYDLVPGKQGRKLEVMKFTSYWCKNLGPQWYVIYRNSLNEWQVMKKQERIEHDFTLPEWKTKPNATIGDLPYLYTHPPK